MFVRDQITDSVAASAYDNDIFWTGNDTLRKHGRNNCRLLTVTIVRMNIMSVCMILINCLFWICILKLQDSAYGDEHIWRTITHQPAVILGFVKKYWLNGAFYSIKLHASMHTVMRDIGTKPCMIVSHICAKCGSTKITFTRLQRQTATS